jgi:peptide/nickel transport system permease protein
MPAALRRWILIWTPVVWLVLELIRYPKDVPVSSGLVAILGGFFAPTIGDYPPVLLSGLAYLSLVFGIGLLLPESIKVPAARKATVWLIGLGVGLLATRFVLTHFLKSIPSSAPDTVLLVGAVVFVIGLVLAPLLVPTRKGGVTFPVLTIVLGIDFIVWAVAAGSGVGDGSGFSLTDQVHVRCWVFQTIAVLLGGALVWAWGAENPERAELTVKNTRQTWALFRANRQGMVGLWIIVVFVLVALLAPFLADHAMLNPDAQNGHHAFEPPSLSYYYLMGTDNQGLSVLAEFIWSARISLLVGIMATLISTLLGAGVGITAGYFLGWIGEVSMRVTDAFLVIPWLPLAMVLAATWGQNYVIIIIIIGVTSWPGTARVVRSDALRVRELQFVERARAIGSGPVHIMGRHILPNVFPLIFANTILVVAAAITAETELSFLGLGDPLNFSWGTMLHNAWGSGAATMPAWWFIIPPGVAIVFVVLAFTFMGTAFDEILDPQLRRREDAIGGGDRLTLVVEPTPDR